MSNTQANRRQHKSSELSRSSWRVHWVLVSVGMLLVTLFVLAVLSITVFPTLLRPSLADEDLASMGTKDRLEAQDARAQRQNEVMATLLQSIGALSVLTSAGIGVFLTFKQLQINREGQITERFTRAVDQLGNDSTDVRLGGAYGLQRIARDSKADRDAIVEVAS